MACSATCVPSSGLCSGPAVAARRITPRALLPRRHLPCACTPRLPSRCAYAVQNRSCNSTTSGPDPFVSAVVRLDSLLAGIGDGEEELLDSGLQQDSPMTKLQITAMVAGLTVFASVCVCWLLGKDPLGGASLSVHSLQCAAVGALCGLPLAAARVWSWSKSAHQRYPPLEEVHRHMLDTAEPWLVGLQSSHVLALVALDTVPLLMLQLPAAQAGLTLPFDWYNNTLTQVMGSSLPPSVGLVAALLLTAVAAGLWRGVHLAANEEEMEVVSNAVRNADRYYRLMAMNKDSTVADAEQASTAFKLVCVSWLANREDASTLAAAMSFLDVVYAGTLWYGTGDLTTAAVALMLAYGVDYHYMMQIIQRKGQGSNRQSSSS